MSTFNKILYRSTKPSVVALGCFDGVHLGHASVIKKAVAISKELGLPCIVFTFDTPPKSFFCGKEASIITSNEKKAELISSIGADTISVPFTADIAILSPNEFAKQILVKKLNAAHIVCGFNYTFGARAAGNTEFLSDFCKNHGIGLTVMPKLEVDGDCVSSSIIRELIRDGNVERAASLLGRAYSISAEVIGDKGLARKLGFATANQVFPDNTLMPKNAVYETRTTLDGTAYPAITNVGTRPTVNGKVLCAETHILDFSDDLYGKTLEIEFVRFIREERKFDSIDELRMQVINDIKAVKSK